ncbi:MAG: DUF4860 domain-containing protein [Erysipelotrichaceae bacterium]|nr:DUF4860 domain-containing protein [Erysipelotrichaceae bacterium]MDD3808810.1 DUF4860 domain-containing protein [Erysipelotrichaceae bacterium]
MNKSNLFSYLITGIFIFTLSAICILMLNITNKTAIAQDALVDEQFVISFINEKIKRAKSVEIKKDDTSDILALEDGSSYVTYLYNNDGYLCELYVPAGREFDMEYGDRICSMEKLDMDLIDGLLVINENYYLNLEGKP